MANDRRHRRSAFDLLLIAPSMKLRMSPALDRVPHVIEKRALLVESLTSKSYGRERELRR
jgi:hypothetical protein